MKLVIAGGRDFVPKQEHWDYMEKFLKEHLVHLIVSGAARGADQFGEALGKKLSIRVKKFPADWKTYGLTAGPIRNEQMAEFTDAVFLFPGGGGTQNMRKQAIKYGRKVYDYPVKS